MITQNRIEGGWTELKGKIKDAWGELNGNELTEFEGDMQQLVGMIQRKSGETQEEIQQRLQELDDRFRPMFERAAATAKQYAEQTAQAASETAERFRDGIVAGHAEAEHRVRQRPMESVALAFGTGIVAGVLVGLLVRSR